MAVSARRLAAFQLNAAEPAALAEFFAQALGFNRQPKSTGAEALTLGSSRLEIARATGRPYPAAIPGWNVLFQHFAISTPDMAAAYARLGGVQGWTAISTAGPERLPREAGGVTAFKFRDPEGHPLELIAFPGEQAPPMGEINHSALSVADTARSIAFYQALGLTLGARSLNHGPSQSRLDGLDRAEVEVTALNFAEGGAHVELLCYHGDYRRDDPPADPGDVAATCLVLSGVGGPAMLRDPDGHLLRVDGG